MTESSKPEREMRILSAADELITHYGYDKTTVEDIARAAGVSKGAIYLHFKSKEDLFEALLLSKTDESVERFFALLDADPGGVTIFNIYRYSLEVVEQMPLLKAIYLKDRRILGDYIRRLRDTPLAAKVTSFTGDFIRHFQQAGLIRRDLDADMIGYLLIALRYGLLSMEETMPEGTPSIAAIGETLAEMLARGLESTEPGDQEAGREALEQLIRLRQAFVEEREANRSK